jgi:anaerobic magnesium-protoporphyrin IX monomethyl ester cyclase
MTTAPPLNSPWGLPMRLPPIGLAYVAASLEKAGFQVEMLDNYVLNKPIDEIKQTIRRLNPEIVGITCSSATYNQCVETAKVVKETLPSCKVVVGGWHPSYVPESMLQHPEVDYVVMGEGEHTMVALATHIAKSEEDEVATIPGLAYRRKDRMVTNPQRFISDLDEVPFPARHLLPMHLYDRTIEFLRAKPVDTVNVVRGCPYNCAYCETRKLWGRTCRAFSPIRVVAELEHMISNYGTKGVYFVGDNFTIRKKETAEICELLKKQKLDLEWVCDTRVDLVSRDLLRTMKAAGCRTIWFGVESGSPRILKRLNKGITLEQALQAFELCKEEGLQTSCSFILGIPGETVRDMEATFKFAKKLNPDWCQFNIFIACPGSGLYDEVLKKHLYDRQEGFLLFVKTEEFDYQSLLKIQRRFQSDYDLSPKRILSKMRKEGFINVLKKGYRYYRR